MQQVLKQQQKNNIKNDVADNALKVNQVSNLLKYINFYNEIMQP